MAKKKMNPRVKKLWLKALRSGEYKQAIHRLRRDDTFCCLGVLCNLHAYEHPDIAAAQKSKYLYMGEEVKLPPAVMEWAGLEEAIPIVNGRNLAGLNDDNWPFKDIADLIERQL